MLEKLSQVQTLDLDVDAIESKKQLVPPELTETKAREAQLERELASLKESHHDLRRQINANELELSNLSNRRKAAADSASAAANAKEVAQYQNQELQFATRLEELESDTFPLLEEMEALEARMNELQSELGELEPVLAELVAKEEARLAELDEELAAILGHRDALARELDASLLKQYEQVRRAKRGLGLVHIVGKGRCGGCNMQLPLHVIQKASQNKGITRCPSCGRILWHQNDA